MVRFAFLPSTVRTHRYSKCRGPDNHERSQHRRCYKEQVWLATFPCFLVSVCRAYSFFLDAFCFRAFLSVGAQLYSRTKIQGDRSLTPWLAALVSYTKTSILGPKDAFTRPKKMSPFHLRSRFLETAKLQN